MVFTFVLCYVVLATATIAKPGSQLTKQNFYFGLAIASCVTAGGFAAGALSGGELNPAVSTGSHLAALSSPERCWPPQGPVVIAFYVTHPTEMEKEATWYSCYAAEFLGTFVLVFTVVCNVLASNENWSPTSIACSLMVMIYATGAVSGGHLNPAVTFAISLATGDWSLKAAGYVASQLVGGIAAGFAACSLFTDVADVGVKDPYHVSYALMAEFIYTAMLAFTVLNVAVSKRNNSATDGNNFYALAIAWVIIAGGYAVGGVSGAAFNPAVAIGLDVSSYSKGVGMGFLWGLFELLGAVAAVALYRVLRPEDYLDLDAAALDNYQPSLSVQGCAKDASSFKQQGFRCPNVVENWTQTQRQLARLSIRTWSVSVALLLILSQKNQPTQYATRPLIQAKLLSEFLGVFMLVLTVGLNLVNGSPATAWSAAAALMCMIYCLGNISGAHLNPAVTMAVVASGRKLCHHSEGVAYASTQLLAGTVAGFVYSMYHAAGPKHHVQELVAGLVELSATLLLAYVVLSCSLFRENVQKRVPYPAKLGFYFALAIGSCVTVGGFAIGAVSGGELNPAVALGITAASGMQHPADTVDHSFSNFVRLGIWEMTGAFAAAAFFKISHSKATGTGEGFRALALDFFFRLQGVRRHQRKAVLDGRLLVTTTAKGKAEESLSIAQLSQVGCLRWGRLQRWFDQMPRISQLCELKSALRVAAEGIEARRPRSVTELARPEKVMGDESKGAFGRRVAVAVAFSTVLARPRRAMALSVATATEDEVVNVVDGDTVKLKQAGRCRLIGVNTPETVAPRQKEGAPPDCYGPEASALTKGLLPPGSKVRIEFDVEPTDKYGRQLVYVYRATDGLFINGELVKKGAARRLRVPPNVRYDDFFTKLETDARAARVGLWKSCPAGAVAPLIAKPFVDPKELKKTTCRDFSSYQEAKAWFDKYFSQYGDVAGLDGDKDGKPCEKLLRSK
ncbi:nucI [Symbiodinium sp. CCMP2456]|nr:nucI [Symbiodinium sp. CCMP2456]